MKMKPLRIFVVILSIAVCACSTVPDAAPGLNGKEMSALTSTYYWKQTFGLPRHDRESLAILMDASLDPDLDGERGEGHTSALIVALAESGDEFFASVLSSRSREVREAVGNRISSAWTFSKLDYPKTQAVCIQYARVSLCQEWDPKQDIRTDRWTKSPSLRDFWHGSC
jgi:hypothetical protein